jgi:hypothetical protein
MIYGGRPEGLAKFAAPFRALKPSAQQQFVQISYPEVFGAIRNNESSPNCAKGLNRIVWPSYLKRHDTTSLRKVLDIFNGITAKYPALANSSIVSLEEYAIQAVTRVPAESTATPFREYPILA